MCEGSLGALCVPSPCYLSAHLSNLLMAMTHKALLHWGEAEKNGNFLPFFGFFDPLEILKGLPGGPNPLLPTHKFPTTLNLID